MSAKLKASNDFNRLKQTSFKGGKSPLETWVRPETEIDVVEQLRFNISQLQDLNARFSFLLGELNEVLVRRNPK